ncbi:hypothetical protein LTR08_001452 [Meristemomyces frigidus]|nr:hypothetical protein LTR08_001452 [Meristemomyces frigidus]
MALALPSPGPAPRPEFFQPSISAQINIATRKQHTELNRLLTERLPLALPPNVPNSALLGPGLAAFAQIFFAFETVWQSIEDGQHLLNKYDPDRAHEYDVCSALAFLRPVGLARTEMLREDLEQLAKRLGRKNGLQLGHHETKLAEKIRATVSAKPHVLVAYAWVMYMAVFSGGRWIRMQFDGAGLEFWTGKTNSILSEKQDGSSSLPGYTFLSFPGAVDGEDIKKDFKSRLAETEALLTEEERDEVVEAAQELFDHCIQLVGELDKRVVRQQAGTLVPLAVILALVLAVMLGFYWSDNYGYLRA